MEDGVDELHKQTLIGKEFELSIFVQFSRYQCIHLSQITIGGHKIDGITVDGQCA